MNKCQIRRQRSKALTFIVNIFILSMKARSWLAQERLNIKMN